MLNEAQLSEDEIGHYRQLHTLLEEICPPHTDASVKASLVPHMLRYVMAKSEAEHGILNSKHPARQKRDDSAQAILGICNAHNVNFKTLMARITEWGAVNIGALSLKHAQRLGKKMPMAALAEPAENKEADIKPIRTWVDEWWKTHGNKSTLYDNIRTGLPPMLYKYEVAAAEYSMASSYNEKEDARRALDFREKEILRHCSHAAIDYIQLLSDFSAWRKEQYNSVIKPFSPSRGKS